MHEAKRNIKKRIDEMEGRDLRGGALEEFHVLTDTYKNILKIEMLEDGGYSQGRGGYSMDDDDYSAEYSERRRRDRRGRYSNDGESYDEDESYRRGGRGGYSRDEGMEEMKREFQRMMDNAKSPDEKRAIERCMRQLDK